MNQANHGKEQILVRGAFLGRLLLKVLERIYFLLESEAL